MGSHPLLVGDTEQLRKKLEGASGLLGQYWADYRNRLLSDPGKRSHLLPLSALITGENVEEARENLCQLWRRLFQDDTARDVQFHTWCRSGTVLRYALHFDWLAACGAWSAEETQEAAESFLGFAFKHPYQVLSSRTRACNNQPLAMALNCALLGYVFGCKHADHATGRFLFEYGTQRILDLLGLFPQDGYGGEGSTYTSLVNTPLACWIAEFMKDGLGTDVLDRPFPPNGTRLRDIIGMENHLVSPGGLMPPWDHYGWLKPVNAAPFAYLARTTGNADYLGMIPAFDLWSADGSFAWIHDDPLWTLLWWPEQFKDFSATEPSNTLFGWFLPKTGAALDDLPRRTRLMQVWDACADGISGLCRLQSNPNHLMFEYAGEPVFQDGIEVWDSHPWMYSEDQVFAALTEAQRRRYTHYVLGNGTSVEGLTSLLTTVSTGLTGAANTIIVDNEPWHWPGRRCVGRAEGYVRTDDMQAVSADCSDFYRPRFDVKQALRTSAWSTAEGFGVVLDSLNAESSHTWCWQAHLRPDTKIEGNTARVVLPGGRHVLLAWEAGPEAGLTELPNFPRTQEGESVRLELRQNGSQAEFTVLIAPEATSATVRRLSPTQVETVIDGERRILDIPLEPIHSVPEDVHELPDLEADAIIPFADLEDALRTVAWPGKRVAGDFNSGGAGQGSGQGSGLLLVLDECLAETVSASVDEHTLLEALAHERWPVRAAAANVLGRRRVYHAAPQLRRLLEEEHALPQDLLYPTMDAVEDGRTPEERGKRWRLKASLIVALGRLRDPEAIPILHRIFLDGHDFHAVYSVAAQALGRIGGAEVREVLQLAKSEQEHNTTLRVQAALAKLQNEPDAYVSDDSTLMKRG
jgi:hypothetical protein